MTTHPCDTCGNPIPPGEAKLRGDGRRVRAWHPDCYRLRAEVETAFIPAQRVPVDEREREMGIQR